MFIGISHIKKARRQGIIKIACKTRNAEAHCVSTNCQGIV